MKMRFLNMEYCGGEAQVPQKDCFGEGVKNVIFRGRGSLRGQVWWPGAV